jgi:LysM repeat protein
MANLTIGISKDPAANCENLSLKYNVTTGDLLKVATDESCYLETAVCVPPPCNLVQVPDGSTCDSLATSFSVPGAPLNVTKQMVLSWNPNIIGPCDNLTAAQYVCAGAPGGSYEPPAIAPPNVGAGGQERGGPGGSDPTAITGTPTIIVTSGANINPTEAPKPTQAGSIVGNCNQYDQAETGETCTSFATRNGITPAQLYSWNSILGASGASCATDFWAGYYYCIGTTGSLPPTTTSTTRTSNTPVSAPGPTQSGITASCDSFAEAVAGQTCTVFASAHGITTSELYAWNPVLGTNGANCATSFWAEEWYCVGVSNSAKMVRDTVDVERPWLKYRRGLE